MQQLYRKLVRPLVKQVRRVTQGHLQNGVALALGGGFARGFAHIGVLAVLEEHQIPVTAIAGTSVGSAIGAGYASGIKPRQLAEICRRLRLRDLARWRLSRMGLACNDRLGELIQRWFRALRFEDLRIPLAVVATDLGRGEPYVFTRGELVPAIRASCAFPGLFEPVMHEGRCLTDGGLAEQVPARQAAALGSGCVLAVSVGFNNWDGSCPKNAFQVLSRAISVAQKYRDPSWARYAELIIEPDVQQIDWDEFGRADEAIEAGVAAARRVVPQLRELLGLPGPVAPVVVPQTS